MKIKISKKSISKILLGTIYLAMRSNFNKSDKGLLIILQLYHEKAECADIIASNGRLVRHHTASREQPIRSSAICELSLKLIKVSNDFFVKILYILSWL